MKNYVLLRKLCAALLALSIVALSAGCQKADKPDGNQDGAGEELNEVDENEARLQRIRESNVLEPVGTLTEKSGFASDFPSVSIEEAFTNAKAWLSDTNKAYIVIGTLKDASDASEMSVSLISGLFEITDLDISNAQVESASCGDYFIMAGSENATDIVDKFTEVISCMPVSSIDEIYNALQEKVTVPETPPISSNVVEPENSGIDTAEEPKEQEPDTEPEVPANDVPDEVFFWPGYPDAVEPAI